MHELERRDEMELVNLHMHTTYSDGKNTPEEMVKEAIRLGFRRIGFSDHSFLSFDPGWFMQAGQYAAYQNEVRSLKEAYRDQIEILCGIEQDYYSAFPAEGFDYVIGSVHYVQIDGEYVCTDYGGEKGTRLLQEAAARHFDGDIYALIELFYETEADVAQKTGCGIVGHFDVIAKSNRDHPFFDPDHPRYVQAWKKAADRLLKEDVTFEINLSPVLRNFSDEPHPADRIVNYLKEKGARLICTGDSHSTEQLADFAKLYKRSVMV